jgi:16S rRNA (adenine1518-N6/adenine1519-N6)-dimethyltransferase
MGNSVFPVASSGECGVDNPLNLPQLDIPGLLKRHGLQPDKNLGQNFLIDATYLNRVAEAGNIREEDIVLEIGAGLGNLTRLLSMQAKEVLAVELDLDLIPILEDVTKIYPNIQIIQGDILKIDLVELIPATGYLVIANIPYYITSNLIRHLMTAKKRPTRIVLTIQREVAERICAQAEKFSMLSLSVQVFGNPEIVSRVPAGAFYPPPKVDSAIVRIELYSSPIIPETQLNTFFQLARAGFSQKRKTLRNSLSAGLQEDKTTIENLLAEAGIDSWRRAETLSLDEWKSLTILYADLMPPHQSG